MYNESIRIGNKGQLPIPDAFCITGIFDTDIY